MAQSGWLKVRHHCDGSWVVVTRTGERKSERRKKREKFITHIRIRPLHVRAMVHKRKKKNKQDKSEISGAGMYVLGSAWWGGRGGGGGESCLVVGEGGGGGGLSQHAAVLTTGLLHVCVSCECVCVSCVCRVCVVCVFRAYMHTIPTVFAVHVIPQGSQC